MEKNETGQCQIMSSLFILVEKIEDCQVQWLMLVMPALWEAEVGGSQGQEIDTILANIVKSHLH